MPDCSFKMHQIQFQLGLRPKPHVLGLETWEANYSVPKTTCACSWILGKEGGSKGKERGEQ